MVDFLGSLPHRMRVFRFSTSPGSQFTRALGGWLPKALLKSGRSSYIQPENVRRHFQGTAFSVTEHSSIKNAICLTLSGLPTAMAKLRQMALHFDTSILLFGDTYIRYYSFVTSRPKILVSNFLSAAKHLSFGSQQCSRPQAPDELAKIRSTRVWSGNCFAMPSLGEQGGAS